MEDFGLMTWNKWKSEVFFKECLFLCEQQNSWTKYRCFWQQLNALKGEQLIENPTCIVPSFRSMKELLKMSLLTSSGYIAVPEKVLYADWIISVVLFSSNWLSQLLCTLPSFIGIGGSTQQLQLEKRQNHRGCGICTCNHCPNEAWVTPSMTAASMCECVQQGVYLSDNISAWETHIVVGKKKKALGINCKMIRGWGYLQLHSVVIPNDTDFFYRAKCK